MQRLGRMLVRAGFDHRGATARSHRAVGRANIAWRPRGFGIRQRKPSRTARRRADGPGVRRHRVLDIDPNAATLVPSELMRKQWCCPSSCKATSSSSRWPTQQTSSPSTTCASSPARTSGRSWRHRATARRDRASSRRRRPTSDDMVGDLEQQWMHDRRRGRSRRRVGRGVGRRSAHEPDRHRSDQKGAGDIYIEPSEHELRIRFRIDGVCQKSSTRCPQAASAAHQPPEDQLGHGHRRATRPSGRAVRRRARRQGGRLPRRGAAARRRRDGRLATPAPRLDHDVAEGPRASSSRTCVCCSRRWRCRTARSS